jgi:ATP-dependent exoDNAse (exonuclease V) beta subunit
LFFHVLELKDQSYPLNLGLELAHLLQFTREDFHDIPARATRAGVRRGLGDWKRKSEGDAELARFVAFLDEIDRLLPGRGTAAHFAAAVEAVADRCGVGELARRALDHDTERDAHAALAALIRNAQMLAASVKEEMTIADWMREWTELLGQTMAGAVVSLFPRIQFYEYGEWLPPAGNETLTVALGWTSSVAPNRTFCFYFEEGARRKLSELLLPSQVQEELTFLDQMKRVAQQGTVIFSCSRHDNKGGELQPTWMASALPLTNGEWPEIARRRGANLAESPAPSRASPEVHAAAGIESFSASLLETYKQCPFRAFALKVLKLEDKTQASTLDIDKMDEGSIVHRTLELYYGEHKGKDIHDSEERARILDLCLAEAVKRQKLEYYKGGEELLRNQLHRLRSLLLEFLACDAEYYAQFPQLGFPRVEQPVRGQLGKYPWTGKVDRVDIDETNKVFVVVDYKTGASVPATKEIEERERFQLPMYMEAMERDLAGYQAAGGLYVSLRTGDRKQGLVRKEFNKTKTESTGKCFDLHSRTRALKSDEDFQRIRAEVLAEALRLAEEMEKGVFDVTPLRDDICKRCEARPACRIKELRSPPRRPWPRLLSAEFQGLLQGEVPELPAAKRAGKGFNEEQSEALGRKGRLVFIEASAGTGKTTVIVEKIRRFLAEKIATEPSHRAVERFAAISFTEKSAAELAERVSAALIREENMGARVAAQAIRQISTIHGFCRRILSDFPVEAGISPMATLLDEKGAEVLREEAFEEFFLHPPEEAREALAHLFEEFSRAKIESLLRKILSQKLLIEGDLVLYRAYLAGERDLPGNLVVPGPEREGLRHLIQAADYFAMGYGALKKERDLLDFNDLEALSLKVLEHRHVQQYYREKFSLLLVDEFQDTNAVQRRILESVAQPGWKNLFVVGDAKQSIYRFRAADVSVFQSLRREAEEQGNLITLFRNYRSRKELVEAANRVSEVMFPAPGDAAPSFEAVRAVAAAEREQGGAIRLVEYGDPEQRENAADRRAREAEIVTELVKEQLTKGRSPGDIAVLLRKISGNEGLLRALTHAGIPFRVGSSHGFYSQQVILDGIALLRTLLGASNDMALLAVLRSPWFAWDAERILELRRRGPRAPLWSLLREEDARRLFEWRRRASFLAASEILAEAYATYPLDRREHLQTVKLLSLLQDLEREAMPKVEVLERVSTWAGWTCEEDSMDDATMPEPGSGGAVQVMTVHASKGLEFDVTILPDLVSGVLPDNSALRILPGVGLGFKLEDQEDCDAYTTVGERNKEREFAEMKRLFYVALTRAKEEAILVIPKEGAPKAEKGGKPKRRETWADHVRAAGLRSEEGTAAKAAQAGHAPQEVAASLPVVEFSAQGHLYMETSISELAALQFCGEFHRRKFVQAWDDRVVEMWPRPKQAFRKHQHAASPGRDAAGTLLRALKIERKERGIALHRVLERVKGGDLEHVAVWLTEAYQAQGVDTGADEFRELLALDLSLLTRFLSSALGQELFSADVTAYPEISFQWKIAGVVLHGTMDRLIRKHDGTWVVVDYKSSILEESLERYQFQVSSYMAAVATFARARGEEKPRVLGYLVDLFEAKSYPVECDEMRAEAWIADEIARVRANYTLPDEALPLTARGIEAGDHCGTCPYSLHCELGKKFVLA